MEVFLRRLHAAQCNLQTEQDGKQTACFASTVESSEDILPARRLFTSRQRPVVLFLFALYKKGGTYQIDATQTKTS